MITLILDNIRSIHNVGSIFRSADGFGVEQIICVGITPYPKLPDDQRLPHIAERATNQIAKTALGAEKSISFSYSKDIKAACQQLNADVAVVALEKTPTSIPINSYQKDLPMALIVGNEPKGVSPEALALAPTHLEIPMVGQKESFNVSVATGIALYALTSS